MSSPHPSSSSAPRRHHSQAGGGSLEESFSGVNDFRSQPHQQLQHPLQLDDCESVTSSVLSQSFSSSFRSRRSSVGSTHSYSGGAARRASLLGDISETGASSAPPPRRGVTFNPKVQVQVVPSRSDYTEDEISRTWHSKADGERMKRDVLVTVKAMRKLHERRVPAERVDYELVRIFSGEGKHNVDADKTTTDRGLEHMRTTRSVENRRRHKKSVVTAVLDEQDALWDENDVDADDEQDPGRIDAETLRIAEAGMVVSRPARQDAARKGQRDARMVEQWRREDEEEAAMAMAASAPQDFKLEAGQQRASRSMYAAEVLKVRSPAATPMPVRQYRLDI